jgi:hypothetical protein
VVATYKEIAAARDVWVYARVGGRSYWFSGGVMIFGVTLLRPCVNFFLSAFWFFICLLNMFLFFL